MSTYRMVSKHVDAIVAEAATLSISTDVVARNLLSHAVDLFRRSGRTLEDIRSELIATADNVDDDEPISFMRP